MIKFVFAGAALVATGAGLALAQPAPLNGDRTISVADFKQRDAERFARLDTNHDGQLSQQELEAGRSFMHGPGGRGGRFGMHRPGEGFGMGPGRGPGGPGGPGPMFEGADANHDGKITPEERRAAHPRRGGPGGPGSPSGPGAS